MKLTRLVCIAVAAMASISSANAGGLLTNTNQSISFNRNPARDAAIGVDGVYSNPAGVVFMDKGFHFGLNWQTAVQTRTVETTSPYLDHTLHATMADAPTKRYRGHSAAPFIPSIQAAYNTDRWSFQFGFAVAGGGGKCEFTKGLGTFDNAVGQIATMLKPLGVMGYSVDNYMEGRQYYFGVTLGAAYKLTDNISVYGGLRGLIANDKYIARVKDIQVATQQGLLNLSDFINVTSQYLSQQSAYLAEQSAALAQQKAYAQGIIAQTQDVYNQYNAYYDMYKALADQNPQAAQIVAAIDGYNQATAGLAQIAAGEAQIAAGKEAVASGEAAMGQLDGVRDGLDVTCTQHGFGIAPIFGVDVNLGWLNLAAKYEFRTKMTLTSKSNLHSAAFGESTGQFVDGAKVREDTPALLTVGAQVKPVDIVRLNLGWHHYYDKQSKKFMNKQELLSGGANEYLGGVEVDVTDRLVVSCGGQITRYGLTDEYMSDLSFVTNSKSFGFGAKYKANEWVSIQAAYFKTFYDHYKTANGMNDFTRSNDVIGVGCEIDF